MKSLLWLTIFFLAAAAQAQGTYYRMDVEGQLVPMSRDQFDLRETHNWGLWVYGENDKARWAMLEDSDPDDLIDQFKTLQQLEGSLSRLGAQGPKKFDHFKGPIQLQGPSWLRWAGSDMSSRFLVEKSLELQSSIRELQGLNLDAAADLNPSKMQSFGKKLRALIIDHYEAMWSMDAERLKDLLKRSNDIQSEAGRLHLHSARLTADRLKKLEWDFQGKEKAFSAVTEYKISPSGDFVQIKSEDSTFPVKNGDPVLSISLRHENNYRFYLKDIDLNSSETVLDKAHAYGLKLRGTRVFWSQKTKHYSFENPKYWSEEDLKKDKEHTGDVKNATEVVVLFKNAAQAQTFIEALKTAKRKIAP